ncbi:CPBP family intramembrane glutamic endopeptidase [Halopenitus salinus]|jgi:membrane protease YdiL (CAAX protease family)|uniref:CPBP family intramembrane glutamic endopeptidase n=1 Tax=Halopenitus salinus TaxID=1198295 RepID=A0ABD5UY76_9EURY
MSSHVGGRTALIAAVAIVVAIGLGAGGLLLGFLLTLVGGVVLTLIGIEVTPSLGIVLSLVFVQGVGCAGVALAYVQVQPEIRPVLRERLGVPIDATRFSIGASVPNLREALVVAGGYVLAFAGALAGAFAITAYQALSGTSLETGTNQAAQIGMENPEVLLLLIPASILLIGPGEELLFRGVVQGRLREVFSPVTAIVATSVVFAGLHWFALTGGSATGNLVSIGVLIVPSLVFGASYEYTGNVVVPALIHGVYNATLFTLLYVTIAYADAIPGGIAMAAAAF